MNKDTLIKEQNMVIQELRQQLDMSITDKDE